MAIKYLSAAVELHNASCEDVKEKLLSAHCVILDPPFDQWGAVSHWSNPVKICFTNFQNRHHVERLFGRPRFELIWFFKDGRWVSHSLPRITHEHILVYGLTGSAYVGPKTENQKPQKKGHGCVGRDKLGLRTYVPRDRKMLNSVLEYPRNVNGVLGCWGKPIQLLQDVLAWVNAPTLADPYSGSGAACIAASRLGMSVIASEIDPRVYDIAVQQLCAEVEKKCS